MNLLHAPWMPVRKRDGGREWVGPAQLARPDIVAFDADRADFNGALAQFAIGLLQTTAPVERHSQWRALLNEPPSVATLAQWFAPVTAAFEFDGDGARFMQDPVLATIAGESHNIAGLLLDTPSENALPLNKDFWVKRGGRNGLCICCAATALFNLQLNAPEGGGGGGGKFVGIRGGGPLTTLVTSNPRRALWHDVWANVIEQNVFANLPGDEPGDSFGSVFPWLHNFALAAGTRKELTPAQLAPAHVLWATPRRMSVDFDNTKSGTCDVCNRANVQIIESYRDTTGGLHYKQQSLWNHPLSPYHGKDEEPLQPVRQRSPVAYRDWLGIAASSGRSGRRSAKVIEHCIAGRYREMHGQLQVWAFGYDLKKGKPVAWYEATVPLYGLADCDADAQRRVEAEVGRWLDAAEMAAYLLRDAVKNAWFKEAPKKADFSAIDAAFWGGTEAPFYRQLQPLIGSAASGDAFDAITVNTAWLAHLQRHATGLFDHHFVGTGPVAQQQPRRIAEAYQVLKRNMYGPKLRETLGLPVNQAAVAARKVSRTGKARGAKT